MYYVNKTFVLDAHASPDLSLTQRSQSLRAAAGPAHPRSAQVRPASANRLQAAVTEATGLQAAGSQGGESVVMWSALMDLKRQILTTAVEERCAASWCSCIPLPEPRSPPVPPDPTRSWTHHSWLREFTIDNKASYVTLEHRRSHKQHGYICSNNQKYIVWVKIINFYFMPKIIRILRSCSIKIFCEFPTTNILKRNYWLLICIAKNVIWTTLKVIFFWHPQIPDFQIVVSQPNIVIS